MADNTPRLVVALEARLAAFEKQMAKANRIAESNLTKMERRSKVAAATMERSLAAGASRVGGAFKTMAVGALASVLSLTGAINGAKAAIDKFSTIKDVSAAAGLDPETFQALAYQSTLR